MNANAQMTRADVVAIVTAALGQGVKERLDQAEAKVAKFGEMLARAASQNPQLAGVQRAWVDGIDDPDHGRVPMHLRAGESAEEALDRFSQRSSSRMWGKGLGKAPVRDSRGLMACRMMRLMTLSGFDMEGAMAQARSWGDDDAAGALEQTRDHIRALNGASKIDREMAMRALGTSSLTSGGAFVPVEFAQEILDILHAKTVVLELGAMSLPLVSGNLTQAFLDTGATAGYIGENDATNSSEPTSGELTLSGKEIQAVVPISNKLMAEASVQVDAMIRNHLVRQFKKRMDLAMIRGDGTQNTPRGLRYWVQQASAAHRFTRTMAGGSATLDEITRDLTTIVSVVEGEDVGMDSPGWIMSVRDKWGLFRRRDGNGNLVFAPEMRAGMLWGYAYGATSQVPTTLGSGNKSEVYFADFATCVNAERGGIEVEAVKGAAYNDASGTLQSGLSRRQTVISATAEHDFGCLYRGKEVGLIEGIDWGT